MADAESTTTKKRRKTAETALIEKQAAYVLQSPVTVGEQNASTVTLEKLYPGWKDVDTREASMVSLPSSASAYFSPGHLTAGGVLTNNAKNALGLTISQDSQKISRALPDDRIARYAVLRMMAKDPTIDCAIQMHISNALSAKNDTVEPVKIVPKDGKPDKIVDELNAALMPIIRQQLNEWARKAAIYGDCFARVYGQPRIGIENVRCDYYTHPRFVQKYEQGGRLAGYTTSYQGTSARAQQLRLLPPWTFVDFSIPEWHDCEQVEPINVGGQPVDLSIEDEKLEGLIESQEYGTSLIATAYGPWLDLLDGVCSLKMSRRNAARLERMVAVNTGRLDPERASRYLDMVAERISNASVEVEKQSWLEGNVQTVVNHIFPIFGEKGGMQIDNVQGVPDINGLEDVLFHVKRLGSALGIDPSLLGFGDFLSGGLGDGGFFRVSVMAATKAQLLRTAIRNGIQRLCEIHIAYKHGKVFMPDECPWEIEFNAISSAIEREENETIELRSQICAGIIGTLATIDQEMAIVDKRELARTIWETLKLDEEKFETVFPAKKAEEAEKNAAAMADAMANDDDME